MSQSLVEFIEIHKAFKETVFKIDKEIHFWNHFISDWAIPEYQNQFGNRKMFEGGYSAYDRSPITGQGWLKMSPDVLTINSYDLVNQSNNLFSWVMNMALVRSYNALELLVLSSINVRYIKLSNFSVTVKRNINSLNAEVIKQLKNGSSKSNNQHLFEFLKENSPEMKIFLQCQPSPSFKTIWEDFLTLIAIVRHCVVHNGMLINKDTINSINSKSGGDMFEKYFETPPSGFNQQNVFVKRENFIHVLDLINDFATNTIKILSGEKDLSFLEMYD